MELKEIEKYIGQVADEKIDTSEYFRLQCQRHFNDWQKMKENQWSFDNDEAQKHINFITKVARHTKDRWAGKLFGAQPFQLAMIYMLFGWKTVSEDTGDWIRRFQTLFFDIARKNGKTELVATIANDVFLTSLHGTEIYCAATMKDQAKITFNYAKVQMKFMARYSSSIRKRVDIKKHVMELPNEDGIFRPVSSRDDTLDGLNPMVAIIDEYHAHRTSGVLDIMETAQGSRWDGPIMAVTTTAGFDKSYPCYEFRENAIAVLKGERTDNSLLPFIFAMSEKDDWNNPDIWHRPNPNLGVSVSTDFLKKQLQKAINEGPTKQRQFKTKNLNLWVDAEETWLDRDVWIKNALKKRKDTDILLGKRCYGGLDLSATQDLTSFSLIFPIQSGLDCIHVLSFHFCPRSRARSMQKSGYKHMSWANEGWLQLTEDRVVDFDQVKTLLIECKKKYKFKYVAFDRWGAEHVVTPLKSKTGIKFMPFGQGWGDMSNPSKAFEMLVYSETERIEHFQNPVLTWEIGNAVIKTDPAGNIKPMKRSEIRKIDGVVATIMAYGLLLEHENKKSPYKERGLAST